MTKLVPIDNGSRKGYNIRAATDQDLASILDLLRLNLSDSGATQKTVALWRWKHEKSPGGRSYVLVAETPDTGKIVGLRALMLWRVRVPTGDELCFARPVDTATHPDWQRQGIFRKLTLTAIDHLGVGVASYIFNTPNKNSLPGYLKMGWRTSQIQTLYIRPTGILRLLRNWRSSHSFQKRHHAGSHLSISPISQLTNSELRAAYTYCERVEGSRPPIGLRPLRNQETLQWRYSHPSAGYHVLIARNKLRENQIEGVVFFRFQERLGFRIALVTDYFTHVPEGYNWLLKAALRHIDAAFVVLSSSEGTQERTAVSKLMFFAAKHITIVTRPVNLEGQRLGKQLWDTTLADLEIF